VVSAEKAEIQTGNGVWIKPDYDFSDCPPPDIICVPDFPLPADDPCVGRFDPEVAWLRQCHAAGATLACTCTAAILLAQTGLLDGMEATIHWNYAPSLAKHYPRLRVDPDKALVVTGLEQRIVMAGGGTSHLDLILYLIARFVGLTEALEVAKAYLITWHDAGQRPFTSLLTGKQTSDGLIARCQEWAADHYAEAAPVTAMARLSGLSDGPLPDASPRRQVGRRWITFMRCDWKRRSRSWKPRICRSRRWHWRSAIRTTDFSDACFGDG
jgi:transcriptional regulator GlxA family with amidase domain